ncbi:MAG: NAD(P)/FAD-dependent oxidoreductase [Deltaproteobacteria bacterium]|nr:NAD(P)/FAD-dependent oxidoreductase [Deltaproteobacteria bacterium]
MIGAGPSGIAEALAFARRGAKVALLESAAHVGGHLAEFMEPVFGNPNGWEWAKAMRRELEAARVDVRLNAEAIGRFEEHFFVACDERGLLRTRADRVIVATGAYDQNELFADSDRAGVYSARAFSKLVALYGVLPARNVLIAGSGDFAVSLALSLPELGARVAGVVEKGGALRAAPALAERLRSTGTPVFLRHRVTAAVGWNRVKSARVAAVDEGEGEITTRCDAIIVDAPRQPSWEIASQAGADVGFVSERGVFQTRCDPGGATSQPWLFVAGEAAGDEVRLG